MKKIHLNRFTILISLIFILTLLWGVKSVQAATLSVTPDFRQVNDKELLTADVRLNSEGQVVNAVQAVITYPADVLEVVEVVHSNSFLTLWPQEPTVDSTLGTITMVGGLPNGSLVIDGLVAKLTFRIKSINDVEIAFDETKTSVRLNDGLGTAAKLTTSSGIYKIKAAVFTNITSSTHPQEDVWYNNNNPKFQWSVEEGAAYSYILSDDPTTIPDDTRDSIVGEVEYKNLNDGIHYFILKKQASANKWDILGIRRVMIDAHPPRPVQVVIAQDPSVYENKKYLMFTATDATSGIDHYRVDENGTVTPKAKSPFLLKDQTLTKPLEVSAFDRAGNEASKVLVAKPTKLTHFFELLLLVIGLIIVLAAGLIVFINSKSNK